MIIHGLQKLTLLDYPEHLAAVLFTGSCNFRCPFCQNGSLVLNPAKEPVIPEDEIFSLLKKRRGILTGVCITGGEPTLHQDLPEFIKKIKELGYQVKLDTNGTNPSMVKQLYSDGLLDYVAMDIKTSRSNYALVSGCPGISMEKLQETIDFLMTSDLEYEFRTTVVKGLHTHTDFEDIGQWIAGARRYYLQSYQDSDRILQKEQQYTSDASHIPSMDSSRILFELTTFTPKEMKELLAVVLPAIPSAKLRGIDDEA